MVSSGSQSEAGTITGKVVDTGSLKESPFSLTYKMEVPAQCSVGKTYWFGGNKIQICSSSAKPIDYQTCENGVVGDGQGGWKCAIKPSDIVSGGDNKKGGHEIGFRNWYNTPQAILLAFLGLSFGITLFSNKRRKK
jgi:hypothetical protein